MRRVALTLTALAFATAGSLGAQELIHVSTDTIPSKTCEGSDVVRLFTYKGRGTVQLLRTYHAFNTDSGKVVTSHPFIENIYSFSKPDHKTDLTIGDFDEDGDTDILISHRPLPDREAIRVPSYVPTFLSNDGQNRFTQEDFEESQKLKDNL